MTATCALRLLAAALVLAGTLPAAQFTDPLPAGWTAVDISGTGGGSAYDAASGAFRLSSDARVVEEGGRFVHQGRSGDFVMVCRVVSATADTDLAGIMIRSDLSVGNRFACYGWRPDWRLFTYRTVDAGRDRVGVRPSGQHLPLWLKLVRRGGTIATYLSQDGVTWAVNGEGGCVFSPDQPGLPERVLIGLAVTGRDGRRGEAVIDNIRFEALSLPYASSWIGNSFAGNYTFGYALNRTLCIERGTATPTIFMGNWLDAMSYAAYDSGGNQIASFNPPLAGAPVGGGVYDGSSLFWAIADVYDWQGDNRGGIVQISSTRRGIGIDTLTYTLSRHTITGLEVRAGVLYASDATAGRVRLLDTVAPAGATTLPERSSFALARPGAIAGVEDGTLWVVQQASATEPARVLRLTTTGASAGASITFAGRPAPYNAHPVVPAGIARRPNGDLAICDTGWGNCVWFYHPDGSYAGRLGESILAGTPGTVTAGTLIQPTTVAFDTAGACYLGTATGFRKYDVALNPLWERYSTEYFSMADADPASDCRELFTTFYRYEMDYSQPTGREWRLAGYTLDPVRYPADPRAQQDASLLSGVRIRRIGGQKFLYLSAFNDGFYIYRFVGEIAVPCGRLTARDAWTDHDGDGVENRATETQVRPESLNNNHWKVDAAGDIWGLNWGIICFRLGTTKLNAHGVPLYPYLPSERYTLPATGPGLSQVSHALYDAATDTMVIGGYDEAHPVDRNDQGSRVGAVLACYDGWRANGGAVRLRWRTTIPLEYSTTREHHPSVYQAAELAGDHVFIAGGSEGGADRCAIRGYRLSDGAHRASIAPGPEICGWLPWLDDNENFNALRRANGEHLLFIENYNNLMLPMFRVDMARQPLPPADPSDQLPPLPADGLIAHWPCNEGTGTWAYDATPFGNDLDHTRSWVAGRYGAALSFTRVAGETIDDRQDALAAECYPPHPWLRAVDAAFGVSAWVRIPTGWKGTAFIAGMTPSHHFQDDDTWNEIGLRYGLVVDNGRPLVTCKNGGRRALAQGAGAIDDGQWHHLLGQKTTTGLELYLDGVLVAQAPASTVDVGSAMSPFRLGHTLDPVSDLRIDEVRVYARAWDLAAVRIIRDGGHPGRRIVLRNHPGWHWDCQPQAPHHQTGALEAVFEGLDRQREHALHLLPSADN